MRGAGAFLIPATRPVVVLLLVVTMASVAVLLVAVTDDDFPTRALDVGVLAMLGFAGSAGFLAGASLRELQHCRFTWVVPGVRRRTALGYATSGVVVSGVTALFVKMNRPDPSYLALVGIGVAAFSLGGVLFDPRSRLRSLVHGAAALMLVAGSLRIGEWCAARPAVVVLAAAIVAGLSLHRALGVASFRELPFRTVAPLPGAFALSQTARHEMAKLARRRGARSGMGRVPSGTGAWNWLRRGIHENFLGRPLRTMVLEWRALVFFAVIIVMHAVDERGGETFLVSLARTLYHVILKPPAGTPAGASPDADMPYLIVPLFLAGVGGAIAFARGVPLGARLAYPLSRAERSRIAFRTGLVENLGFLVWVGGGLFLVSVIAALYVGYPAVAGNVPQVLRAAVATGAILPVFQWFRLKTNEAGPRRSPFAIVGLIFGLIAAVVLVSVWCTVTPKVLTSPAVELAVLAGLFAGAQVLYRRRLDRHFRTEDLG